MRTEDTFSDPDEQLVQKLQQKLISGVDTGNLIL